MQVYRNGLNVQTLKTFPYFSTFGKLVTTALKLPLALSRLTKSVNIAAINISIIFPAPRSGVYLVFSSVDITN
jgi:hypothetical protein